MRVVVQSFESRCVGVLFLVLGLGIAWPAGLEAQMGGGVPTSPEEFVQHYRSEASAAMIQRDFSTALEAFQAMAKVQPTNPEGIGGIGLCLLTLRRYQEAADALATALAMQPNVHGESALPGSLALAYAVLGRQADAEAVLKAHFGERAPVILTGVLEAAQKLRARAPRR